jgi:hypothetical protein
MAVAAVAPMRLPPLHIRDNIRLHMRYVHPTCGGQTRNANINQWLTILDRAPLNPDICPQPYQGFGHWFMVSSSVRSSLRGLEASRCRRFIGDTHGCRVYVSRMMEHAAIRLRQLSGPTWTQCASCKVQSKVCEVQSSTLLFLRFRNSQNFNFADFAFSSFRFGDCSFPACPG